MADEKILIVYSSKTGNTRKVAEGIFGGLKARFGAVRIAAVEENPPPGPEETVFLGFWTDRGSGDKKALKYLKSLKGRRTGLFGTLGAYPDSQHARDTAEKMKSLAGKHNTCLGCFLCQGKIDPKLTEMFKKLPKIHPHSMNPERQKRHEEAAKHPDEADIARAVEACIAMLAASGGEGA
jgi:flavodoxin